MNSYMFITMFIVPFATKAVTFPGQSSCFDHRKTELGRTMLISTIEHDIIEPAAKLERERQAPDVDKRVDSVHKKDAIVLVHPQHPEQDHKGTKRGNHTDCQQNQQFR